MAALKGAVIRREVLTALAADKGLDYDAEMLGPSSTEEGQAFGFVAIGADVLLGLAHAEGFPSKHRRTIRRGTKWIREAAPSEGGRTAAVFLAQAMALSMELLQHWAGDDESAQHHRTFRELIQRVYPLPKLSLDELGSLDEEYRVMETHEVPERVRKGVSMGTGYHQALMDPDFSEFENVDDDEQLVEIQERVAASFLRSAANFHALELTIGVERYASLEPELLTWNRNDFEQLMQQAADQALWAALGEDWKRQAVRVLTREPGEPSVGDDIAAYLRRRTAEMLANPDRQMADRVADLVQNYVYAHTRQETDWNCLTDAAITGYLLRRAEEELVEHAVVNDNEAEQLRRAARSNPEETLDAGARSLSAKLPAFFTRGAASWHELEGWAREHSLDRSRQRRAQAMEKDEPPQILGEHCNRAFGYGYALRAVETTIDGEE